jgi:DeoR family transcriptional regulator of aga operon
VSAATVRRDLDHLAGQQLLTRTRGGAVASNVAIRPDLATPADEPALTIVTNALDIAGELAVRPHVKIVVTGGVARPRSIPCTAPTPTTRARRASTG